MEKDVDKRNNQRKKLSIRVNAAVFVSVVAVISILGFFRSHGLTVEYYNGMNFDKFLAMSVDRNVDSNWKSGSPRRGIRPDHFSIRWSGTVRTRRAGKIEFFTRTDDGARLWIDDSLIIDDWKSHAVKTARGSIFLAEGPHSIKLEYFENRGGASAQLLWQSEGDPFPFVIPTSVLVPSNVLRQ